MFAGAQAVHQYYLPDLVSDDPMILQIFMEMMWEFTLNVIWNITFLDSYIMWTGQKYNLSKFLCCYLLEMLSVSKGDVFYINPPYKDKIHI